MDSGRTGATGDLIHDFHHAEGDKLVLPFDGADTSGYQALRFIGTHAFTAPGQVTQFFEGDHTVVEVNTAGSSAAEIQIQLIHQISLVGATSSSSTERTRRTTTNGTPRADRTGPGSAGWVRPVAFNLDRPEGDVPPWRTTSPLISPRLNNGHSRAGRMVNRSPAGT